MRVGMRKGLKRNVGEKCKKDNRMKGMKGTSQKMIMD
jgi:hypothetical protein